MSQLVDELKREHTEIAAALGRVRELGVTSPEGQRTLLEARGGLLAHLKKEDERLYPVLRRAAEGDAHLARILEMFAADMDEVSAGCLGFFEKYAGGGEGLEFAGDFGRLYATLSHRISREENILYKAYDELHD